MRNLAPHKHPFHRDGNFELGRAQLDNSIAIKALDTSLTLRRLLSDQVSELSVLRIARAANSTPQHQPSTLKSHLRRVAHESFSRILGVRHHRYLWLIVASARPSDARTFRCEAGETDCLIAAMVQANGNGRATNTIRLAPGTYEVQGIDNQEDGPNGLPSVTSKLAIEVDGEGAATITRVADVEFRLLHVSPEGNLTLRGVVVSQGSLRQTSCRSTVSTSASMTEVAFSITAAW